METREEKNRRWKREWAERNRESLRKASRAYYRANKSKIKQWHLEHKEEYTEARKERKKNDYGLVRRDSLYSQVNKLIRGYKAGKKLHHSKLEDVLGCTKQEFIQHLESTLPKGRSIKKDYGRGLDKYQVDHIIPCSLYDLTDESEVKMCFNWRNMRLVTARVNLGRSRCNY